MAWLPALIWALFILWMCLKPASTLPLAPFPHFDKLVHFLFYAILASLTDFAFRKKPIVQQRQKIFLTASAYGLLIEVLQETCTRDRHFDWTDAAVNALGACTALFLINRQFPLSSPQ
ncbi:MAG: VanZ family protein [Chitinophagales bacterium]